MTSVEATATPTESEQERNVEQTIKQLQDLMADAPLLGRKALQNALIDIRAQVANPPPPVESAGRVGARLGKVSELTIIVPLAPGGAQRLRAFLRMARGNLTQGDKVGTLHNMRFVFFDNDTRLLFATAYDGEWDAYIDDFVTKIPDYLDIIDSSWEGWPGIRSPGAKDYLAKHQVTAEGWYVAHPVALSVFADSEESKQRVLANAREQYERSSAISVVHKQDFGAQPGDLNSLGYKDGIDQPPVEGSGVEPLPGQGRPIKAGEFILGYPGEAGVPLPMPHPDVLGRNGSYVGLRKYQSRVGAFNRFLRMHGSTEAERELLAAKLVGRWRSGAPLALAPDVDDPALGADPQRNNNFNYSNDPHGRKVPLGSHIRRMNPRDTQLTRLTDTNIHRLIRRGTTYGPAYDQNALSETDNDVPRGSYFLFISAKAMATIEFLQQEWINDGNFVGMGDERDPIIGLQEEGATFTIPREPVRRRCHGIQTFNVLRGGEYFFMPSISALKWLTDLTG